MATSSLHQPFISKTASTMAVAAPATPSVERKTYSPYLQSRVWEQQEQVAGECENKTVTLREVWNPKAEALLMSWSVTWDAKGDAHGAAEAQKRWGHLCLQIPTVLVPIFLAPLLSSQYISEQSPIVVFALIVSGLTGALQSILQFERKSEQHAQAAFRYADLLSDAEEILCKERAFRPPMDVTISKFKMRMDSAERYSPPVNVNSSKREDAVPFSASDMESDAEKSELLAT